MENNTLTQNGLNHFIFDGKRHYAGKHLVFDFYGVNEDDCKDIKKFKQESIESCKDAGATVLYSHFHQFGDAGYTGVIILSESHCSVHTWPEKNLMVLDIMMCGNTSPETVFEKLKSIYSPERVEFKNIQRGIID